jgi:hypothetical protein
VNGQGHRFSIGLEYSPNFNNSTGPALVSYNEFRLAQNAFLLGQYRLTGNLYATAGFGYLEAREFLASNLPPSQLDLFRIESHIYHHYIVTPVGLEYKFGSFFVRPEIGMGWNVSNTSCNTYYEGTPANYSISTQNYKDEENIHNINAMTYPLFFSIGHEFHLRSCTLIFSVKSYYSLNSIGSTYVESGHYYGFGMSLGVRM